MQAQNMARKKEHIIPFALFKQYGEGTDKMER